MTRTMDPLAAVRRRGAAPFLTGPMGPVSGAEAARHIEAMRDHVRAAGAVPGEAVAVTSAATSEGVFALLALWSADLVARIVSPNALDAGPVQVRWHLCPAHPTRLRSDVTPVTFSELMQAKPDRPARAGVRVGDYATLLSTTGTSGAPKIAAHTLRNHMASASGFIDAFPLGAPDRWLLRLPLHHVGGLAILFRALRSGATISLPDPNAPMEADIARDAPTHVSLVPTQLDRLLRSAPQALSQFRSILVGGAPLSDRLRAEAVDRGLPLVASYGLTEMSSVVAATAEPTLVRTPGLAGGVLPGREVAVESSGGLLVRGEPLFAGYMTGAGLDPGLDGDGWFQTGDVGAMTNTGHLLVRGRRDLVFITGGENVHPEEIENVLLVHASIEQAIVVAVSDDEYGQRPVAFVRIVAGSPVTRDELREHCRERLEAFKTPDRFFALPDTTDLKPNRHYLRDLATNPRATPTLRDIR